MENKREFISGVVEGFYGRPWTSCQRIKLFMRLKRMGLNTYLYAPKDDLKHRQIWRDLYSESEATQIKMLIDSSISHNITFIYALSPGLDITFSNSSDLFLLKQKMNQVMNLGCNAFALLFDDIDTNLNELDKNIFPSFAYAQATITNDIFLYLNKPSVFLFCPTEYCSTRAIPSISNSEYLQTIGSTLLPEIDIMWTGPKVISKTIPLESILKLSEVLKRLPIIWDNIHANDYDNKRLFLGPFCGRSSKLKRFIRGILLNPNCEFEANFVAMHTLAQWSRIDKWIGDGDILMNEDESVDDFYQPSQALHLALIDWLKLIYEGRVEDFQSANDYNMTNSTNILITGNNDLSIDPISILPEISKVSVCVREGEHQEENNISTSPSFEQGYTVKKKTEVMAISNKLENEISSSSIIPADQRNLTGTNIINVSDKGFYENKPSSETNEVSSEMDLIPKIEEISENHNAMILDSIIINTYPLTPMDIEDNQTDADNITDSMAMQVDNFYENTCEKMDIIYDSENNCNSQKKKSKDIHTTKDKSEMDCALSNKSLEDSEIILGADASKLSLEDLHLLVNMFFLPYEHSQYAIKLLNLIYWLQFYSYKVNGKTRKFNDGFTENSDCKTVNSLNSSDDVLVNQLKLYEQWKEKAEEFNDEVEKIHSMVDRFSNIPNRSILYDLYPYLQDVRYIMATLNSYVKWMGNLPGCKESLFNNDHEPWVFRGGLLAEFQRMFPLEGSNDLFPCKISYLQNIPEDTFFSVNNFSEVPLNNKDALYNPLTDCENVDKNQLIYVIQPYRSFNKKLLYNLCFDIFCKGINDDPNIDNKEIIELKSEQFRDLPGDRFIGPFLEFCSDTAVIVEDEKERIVGYAFGTAQIEEFIKFRKETYNPKMLKKYSSVVADNPVTEDDSDTTKLNETSLIEILISGFSDCTFEECLNDMDDAPRGLVHINLVDLVVSQDSSNINLIGHRLLKYVISTFKKHMIENEQRTHSPNTENLNDKIHSIIGASDSKKFESGASSGFTENISSSPKSLHINQSILPMKIVTEIDCLKKWEEVFFEKLGFEMHLKERAGGVVSLMWRFI